MPQCRNCGPALIAIVAAIVTGFASAPRALAAACPASDVFCQSGDALTGETMSTTTSPTFSKICSGPVMNIETAQFDVPAGHFEVGTGEGGGIRLWLRDDFTVTGPAPGTPVTLHMRVRLHGGLNWDGACCPDSQAHVDLVPLEPQPGDPSPHWSFGKTSGPFMSYPFSDSLDISLERTTGTPIGIEFHAVSQMQAPSSSFLAGDFSFLDLPPGWTVTSCKGYRQEQPVPAMVASWGRVKAIYR